MFMSHINFAERFHVFDKGNKIHCKRMDPEIIVVNLLGQ